MSLFRERCWHLASMKIIDGLKEIVARYDLFIVDQYGVLHNGTVAHPGAVECFHRLLKEHNKRVVILSNTSRRASAVRHLLTSLGFDGDFDGAVTGGEAAWHYLRDNKASLSKCAVMTSDVVSRIVHRATNDQSIFHGLDLQVTPIEQAEFLLVDGSIQICFSESESEAIPLDFYRTGKTCAHIDSFIETGLARGLPLVCTNPDLVSIEHGGRTVHMGGKIAELYEARGGQVLYFGKPLKEHFAACIELATVSSLAIPRSRIVHVGDSMQHDIQGASNAAIDSVFIGRGIHAEAVLLRSASSTVSTASQPAAIQEPEFDKGRLDHFVAQSAWQPTYAIPAFTW